MLDSILSNVVDRTTDFLESACDELGLPEQVGDLVGCAVDVGLAGTAVFFGHPELASVVLQDGVENVHDLFGKDRKPAPELPASAPANQTSEASAKDPTYWMDRLEKEGFDSVYAAIKDGKLPEEVWENESFAFLLQQEAQKDARKWQLLSTLSQLQHQMLSSVIGNMRG